MMFASSEVNLPKQAYAPGVPEEVTDIVDLDDDDYERTYGHSKYDDKQSVIANQLINSSQEDAIKKLANELNIRLNADTKDYLYQYYLQRKNDEWAYEKQTQYDASRYQRTVQDLQKAGLNPFLALQSLSPSSSNVGSGSIQSGHITNLKTNQQSNQTDIARGIMTVIGIIAAAAVGALL